MRVPVRPNPALQWTASPLKENENVTLEVSSQISMCPRLVVFKVSTCLRLAVFKVSSV